MGMLMRPHTVPRDTLENIMTTKYWTLNHVRQDFLEDAHQCSARYSPEVSECDCVNLTEEYTSLLAPYVKEAFVKIGLKLTERVDLKSNGTHFLVGEIQEVILPEESVLNDGLVDLNALGTLTVSGLDTYHSTSRIARLPYAKPKL